MEIIIKVPYLDNFVDLLTWTLETYGLPGHKFQFHPGYDHMYFYFKDEQDALFFQLKTGGLRHDNYNSNLVYL